MEFVSACPMCSAPVMFGGGITMTNFGFVEPISGLKNPSSSHHSYHACSTFLGSYDFAIGTIRGSLYVPFFTARAAASAATSSASGSSLFFFLGFTSPLFSFAILAASCSTSLAFFASSLAIFAALSAAFLSFFAAAFSAASGSREREEACSARVSVEASVDSVTGPGPGAGKVCTLSLGMAQSEPVFCESRAAPKKDEKCFSFAHSE
mmetsp:Transcript_7366/g.27759  ORF Transcript_7366/g.27759 Transcript_7366/m.27759 type:complete len:208 (+) Transcript_7366:2796-3419(+)